MCSADDRIFWVFSGNADELVWEAEDKVQSEGD